jgi:Calcineurin-like phosphoesterase
MRSGRDLGAPRLDPLFDPRWGDVGDDGASPKQRSLLAIAGSLLVEISLPKLIFAATILLLLPAVLLGVAPLVASAWYQEVSRHILQLTGIGAAFVVLAVIAVGWIGWRPLWRLAETNFWSLNALAVQPGYVFWREALRHLSERLFSRSSTAAQRAQLRSATSAGAGIILCGFALLVAALVWPATRWIGNMNDFVTLHRLIVPTLANAVVLVSGYLGIAALIWGFADATMPQPFELAGFDTVPAGVRAWRVAHLSDIHVVGEQYGFRIESGRAGPRGNERLAAVMARLEDIHASRPLDLVLVTGDITDAGLATEWAEFLDLLAEHPAIAERMIVVPGNHDVNIVDRANPARLDLPFSPGKRLRQMRTLSAIAAVQGDRVRVIPTGSSQSTTLNEALVPYRRKIVDFADNGGIRRAASLRGVFDGQFPMILPPDTPDGLGVAILNSNAQTHFSFTNALGLIPLDEAQRLAAAVKEYPQARWIVALHHHLIEYPMRVGSFSDRIGTALVNGSWFIRKLGPFAARTVVMHGHRHIDWTGACGALKIISAPSPVMGAADIPTEFHILKLAPGPNGELCLLDSERVEIGAAQSRSLH